MYLCTLEDYKVYLSIIGKMAHVLCTLEVYKVYLSIIGKMAHVSLYARGL